MWDWLIPYTPAHRRFRLWMALIGATVLIIFYGTVLAVNALLYDKPHQGFSAKARWSDGVLVADLSYARVNLAAKDPIEIIWVSLEGVSGDEPTANTSNGGSVTIPFSKYTGVGNNKSTMDIRFRTTGSPFPVDEWIKVDVPAK